MYIYIYIHVAGGACRAASPRDGGFARRAPRASHNNDILLLLVTIIIIVIIIIIINYLLLIYDSYIIKAARRGPRRLRAPPRTDTAICHTMNCQTKNL